MASTTTDAQPKDGITTVPGAFSLTGSQQIGEPQLLFHEPCEGSTIDTITTTGKWTATAASGGTGTLSGGGLTLSPSTNTAGDYLLQSQKRYACLPGGTLVLKGRGRLGTAGVASSRREIGLYAGANDYAYIIMDGASFACRVYSGGAEFSADVPIQQSIGDNLTDFDFEIRMNRGEARFIINGSQIGSFSTIGAQKALMASGVVKVHLRAINTGSALNNTLVLNELALYRVYNAQPAPSRVAFVNQNSDLLIARGPGQLLGITILDTAVLTFQIRDSLTGGSGDVLYDHVTQGAVTNYHIPLSVDFVDGLIYDYVSGTAQRIHLHYR